MKNDKGVTLIVLIITIIILIILAGVGIKTVSFELDNVKLKSFYTKLDTAREAVQKINDTNESYRDEENNLIIIKQQGTVPTEEQNNLIKQVLGTDNLTGYNFRYFTAEQVENILGISGADLNLLIDFESNTIINPEGIEIGGVMYYTLDSSKYTVQLDTTKISGPIDFNYTVQKYGNSKYKITVIPLNLETIKEGVVKYKKTGGSYWTVANDNVIIVKDLVSYDIKYTDANGNTITKTISLSLDAGNNVIATE